MKYISIALLFTGLIIACEQPKSVSNLQKDAQCIAILQCEAKHLKDERFKAATDMNNLDDSLLHLKKKLSIPQEQQFDSIIIHFIVIYSLLFLLLFTFIFIIISIDISYYLYI